MNLLTVILGKLFLVFINIFGLGRGSTWPGHIALNINPNFSKELLKSSKAKIVLIAGTNGKTTTSKLIRTILEDSGKKVLHNDAGANLENGLASILIRGSNILGGLNYDYLIFESDENTLPLIINKIKPDFLILLNLFRDQLDRYGEIDSIVKKWTFSIKTLNKNTKLIVNADDAQLAYMAIKSRLKTSFFGLRGGTVHNIPHGADTIYCPRCNSKLNFEFITFSHLGEWECPKCKLQRPRLDIDGIENYPLPGSYNKYNTLAALLFSRLNGVNNETIKQSLRNFKPAFGRQEKIDVKGKKVQLFLSKNPTSFNESLNTIVSLRAKNILIVLNDRIPDGRDVSWIWDINLESLKNFKNIVVSGDRCYDMALRLKYSLSSKLQITNYKLQIDENLEKAINKALNRTPTNQTLYVLPTYSAMLEIRKILTGKEIL